MSPEQVDRGPVLSRIARKLGEIIFHRDGQNSKEEGITQNTVETKLQEIQRRFTRSQPTRQIDPESAVQVRETLSLTLGVNCKKDGNLGVTLMPHPTFGFAGFSIQEVAPVQEGHLDHDPESAFGHIAVVLGHNSENGSLTTEIQTFGIHDSNGYRKIDGFSLKDDLVRFGFLYTLAETVLASEQPKKV